MTYIELDQHFCWQLWPIFIDLLVNFIASYECHHSLLFGIYSAAKLLLKSQNKPLFFHAEASLAFYCYFIAPPAKLKIPRWLTQSKLVCAIIKKICCKSNENSRKMNCSTVFWIKVTNRNLTILLNWLLFNTLISL